jgi:hypothetical protein
VKIYSLFILHHELESTDCIFIKSQFILSVNNLNRLGLRNWFLACHNIFADFGVFEIGKINGLLVALACQRLFQTLLRYSSQPWCKTASRTGHIRLAIDEDFKPLSILFDL